jgi:hypothetical protein
MTDTVAPARTERRLAPAVFAVAVFSSAALVFLVEPMIAQMLLPRLGGSPAVWNTSLAFFQIALLAGYAYAHLLQRLGPVRRQMMAHIALLAAASLVLPLRISAAAAQSSSTHPILWLMGVLALTIGAPFAALSATAPLLQAWYARLQGGEGGRNPYVLYAASNLGSLLALLAYPFAIQPLTGLGQQALGWSLGYGLFAMLVAVLASLTWRWTEHPPVQPASAGSGDKPGALALWRERAGWVLLAAVPSSLLLGVTAHITTDVASAPFLWVPPLALYLATFVVAFQDPPPFSPRIILILQAVVAPACLLLMPMKTTNWLPLLGVHLASFFLTALVCHQALAARRPSPGRLTEFYLLMSLGGVIGGAFNAFLAPAIFDWVLEYPLVLVLAGLARPWGPRTIDWRGWSILAVGVAATLIGAQEGMPLPAQLVLAAATLLAAFVLRDRAWAFALLCGALAIGAQTAQVRLDITESKRSFFGVVQIGESQSQGIGPVRYMVHGSTLHGAQALYPKWACLPLTYYASREPIGQVFAYEQGLKPSVSFGAIGLGTGTVAAYVRPADTMQFFEIDPLVVDITGDPDYFSYWHGCSRGAVHVTLGDARLSLEKLPDARFDVLLVDAFSSDAVPIHLMTVQAMRTYLRVIKPGGVVILHLSNRNLELTRPAAAVVKAAGGAALLQTYKPPDRTPVFREASAIVLIAARTAQDLEAFRRDPRWERIDPGKTRPWTDDYSNVLGALIGRMQHPR